MTPEEKTKIELRKLFDELKSSGQSMTGSESGDRLLEAIFDVVAPKNKVNEILTKQRRAGIR